VPFIDIFPGLSRTLSFNFHDLPGPGFFNIQDSAVNRHVPRVVFTKSLLGGKQFQAVGEVNCLFLRRRNIFHAGVNVVLLPYHDRSRSRPLPYLTFVVNVASKQHQAIRSPLCFPNKLEDKEISWKLLASFRSNGQRMLPRSV